MQPFHQITVKLKNGLNLIIGDTDTYFKQLLSILINFLYIYTCLCISGLLIYAAALYTSFRIWSPMIMAQEGQNM